MTRRTVPTTLSLGTRQLHYDHVIDPDDNDPIGAELAVGRFTLSGSLVWLLSCLRPGDAVLDLGAHLGTFALPAAMLGARVVAVEGSPASVSLLQEACTRNGLDNIDCRLAVVDDAVRQVEFVTLGPYGTIATPEIGAATGYPSITATTTTVDLLPGGPFRFVKVDLEGVERAILRGARRTLAEVKAMVIESNGHMLHQHESSPRELVRALEASGLTVYEVGTWTLRRLMRPFIQAETIVDYVAVRGGLPLPAGWSEGNVRGRTELLNVLLTEAQHPIAPHREYAERTIDELPWRIARHLRSLVRGEAAGASSGTGSGSGSGAGIPCR
jgi:FkbM family methyltransferase